MSAFGPATRRVIQLVVVTSLAVCSYLVFRAVAVHQVVRAQSQVTPFVFQAQVYFYKTDPSGSLHSTLTVARRSDGTIAEIRSIGPLAKGLYARLIKYPDGGTLGAVDALSSKTTMPPTSPGAAAWYRAHVLNPPSNCVLSGDTLVTDHASVLGHTVAVVRHEPMITQDNGLVEHFRSTQWRAADLGCTTLKRQFDVQQPDGSYEVVSELRPVSLQLTEPNPHFFDTDQNYSELRPSELDAKISERLGFTGPGPGPSAEQDARSIDPKYQRAWAASPDWQPGQ
ncbi:MAG: hypothetical protein ACRD2G_07190 [Terriglobia bacterium]